MKTEMTEKEAREKLARLLTGQHAPYPWEALPDHQWEAVKAAWGLEFATEPDLPDKLWRDQDNNTRFRRGDKDVFWFNQPDRAEILDAMHARYNAYPTLRAAAERAIHCWGKQGVLAAMDALSAELAKGPK